MMMRIQMMIQASPMLTTTIFFRLGVMDVVVIVETYLFLNMMMRIQMMIQASLIDSYYFWGVGCGVCDVDTYLFLNMMMRIQMMIQASPMLTPRMIPSF